MVNLSTLLGVLPVIGPVAAALPEFKKLWAEASSMFSHKDQATLRQAYDLAMSDAADAHDDLADLVAQHS